MLLDFFYYAGKFLSDHLLIGLFFMYVMPGILLVAALMSPFKTRRGYFFSNIALISYVLFLIICCANEWLISDDYRPPVRSSIVSTPRPTTPPSHTSVPRRTATPTPKRTTTTTTDLVRYYQVNFPQTWGYISKNADSPGTYLRTYDRIWGDLQRYRGDGIPFNTLTRYEQSLVHYPAIGNVVYVASSSSSTYHSTRDCYTLLKSSSVSAKPLSYMRQSGPCSKCVGE